MEEFFIKSLEPSTFWSAISAIGTLTAVLVALFLPAIQNYQKIKKITKLINTAKNGANRTPMTLQFGHP